MNYGWSSAAEKVKNLEEFMNIFKDIRLSSTIIADSIRTRELSALRSAGMLADPSIDCVRNQRVADFSRCPICKDPFYEPTCVSKCGHGMHVECAEGFFSKERNKKEFICSICRLPISKSDMVQIRGVLPTMQNMAMWRTIVLTQPWNVSGTSVEPHSREVIDGRSERLYSAIGSLFSAQHDFSRAMGQVIDTYNTIIEENKTAKAAVQARRLSLLRKEREIDDREVHLSNLVVNIEKSISTCTGAMWKQEGKLMHQKDRVIREQLKLERLEADVRAREEELQDSITRNKLVLNSDLGDRGEEVSDVIKTQESAQADDKKVQTSTNPCNEDHVIQIEDLDDQDEDDEPSSRHPKRIRLA